MGVYEEIRNKLDEIYNQIQSEDFSWLDELNKVVRLFFEFEKLKDFVSAIEVVKSEIERSGKNKEYRNKIEYLLYQLEKNYPDYLIERLKRRGSALAQDKSLKEAISKQLLRILEQVRLGNRDAVCGMLLRIFVVNEKMFPDELIEAMKPKYDINLFRAFMYAFLSNFITSMKEGEYE